MKNKELLHCPLCGHAAFNGGGVMGASCSNKHCALYDADIPFDQWNTRASTTVSAETSNCAQNAQSEISADMTWEHLLDYCYDKFLISGNTTEFQFDYKSLFGHKICCRKDGCIEIRGTGYVLYLAHNRSPKQMYDIIKALVG